MASVFKVNDMTTPGDGLGFNATVPAGQTYRVMSISVHFSAAPTTSENLTFTLDANAGTAYNTLVYSVDPSATSMTDLMWYPDGWEWMLEGGDAVDVTFANTDGNTVAAQLTFKAVY